MNVKFSFLVIKIIEQDATKEIKIFYMTTVIPNQSLQVMNIEELHPWKAPHLFNVSPYESDITALGPR